MKIVENLLKVLLWCDTDGCLKLNMWLVAHKEWIICIIKFIFALKTGAIVNVNALPCFVSILFVRILTEQQTTGSCSSPSSLKEFFFFFHLNKKG